MNIAIIGYGKTGKEVERLAPQHQINVVTIFDENNNQSASGLTKSALKSVDVCIDFSTPQAVVENIEAVAACKKNMVVGTTGWYDKLGEVTKITQKSGIGLLYAANFSIGMNIFYYGVDVITELCDKFHLYDIAIAETHHVQKLDSPSGTALALAQHIMQHTKSKRTVLHENPHGKIKSEQLQITSTRIGSIVGNHRVTFDSDADTIELVHNAKNRSGLARGALIAAQWLQGKQGLFTMKDVITSML